ncbi:MAG TPA: serine hydrolase [Pyrinomonadaceae bacterium]|jgi:CubicO group peptidase (beta-lactamase class C family)|nr:serine hydrolase [Pyrinomonadaceae bacterium]
MKRVAGVVVRPEVVRLFVVLVALALQPAAFAQGSDKAARIDEYLTRANKIGQFNGAALVAENGKVIYKKGLGLANMEWNVPNEADTKFRLASVTKQFTAALILQLVDQGKLKLDGKLSEYLPDYRKDVGDKVTIHHLLTHTSGIPSYTSLPKFMEEASRNPYTVADFVKRYASGDLEFEPGAKFRYNNSGYFLLGAIIEKIHGKPYEQVIKENIFDPLGMKNSGYDHHDTILSKRASGYQKTPAGYRNAPYLDMSIPYAAGSLYSTVEDLYLWDQALHSEKIVSAKSKELMFKPFLDNYAYGWNISKVNLAQSKEVINSVAHSGGIHGFSTLLTRYPDQKHFIVLLDNTSQGAYLGRINRDLTNILYNQPFEMPKQSIAEALTKTISERGGDVAAAIRQYRELKATQAAAYDFGEGELNAVGYQLLGEKKLKEAIEIFKLNVEAYPQASNPYDSLGEAYLTAGERELALANYRKAVELNPQNSNAVAIIKNLENPTTKVDSAALDVYVGQYDVTGLGMLEISKDGDKLYGAPTGQRKIELLSQGDNRFFAAAVNFHFTFFKDDKGQVTHALIRRPDGQEIEAKKVK